MRTRLLTIPVRAAALACVTGIGCLLASGCGETNAAASAAPRPVVQQARRTPNPAERAGAAKRAGAAGAPGADRAGTAASGGGARFPGAPAGSHPVADPPQAPPLNPCSLVTGAQAQAIVGAPLVSQREAPLGPTCIFDFRGRQTITVAIESLPFSPTVSHMHRQARMAVGGLPAACGVQGAQMLDVSLSGGRVLNVTAPCRPARAFAIRALRRLQS